MIKWNSIATNPPDKLRNGKDYLVLAYNPAGGPNKYIIRAARWTRAKPYTHWADLNPPEAEKKPEPKPPVTGKATRDFDQI